MGGGGYRVRRETEKWSSGSSGPGKTKADERKNPPAVGFSRWFSVTRQKGHEETGKAGSCCPWGRGRCPHRSDLCKCAHGRPWAPLAGRVSPGMPCDPPQGLGHTSRPRARVHVTSLSHRAQGHSFQKHHRCSWYERPHETGRRRAASFLGVAAEARKIN